MENTKETRFLQQLAKEYPTIQSVCTEIINLQAIMNLPKGTEHFISDIHGEYVAFNHLLNTASGVIREKIEKIYGNTLDIESRNELAILIYYPEKKLKLSRETAKNLADYYRISLIRLIEISKLVASKYTRSKVRKAMPNEFKYVIDELIHNNYNMENKEKYYATIIKTIIDIGKAEDFIIELTKFIKRLAIDQLHIVGDIFDRGPAADRIMELLINHHNVDVQWGNHDILWMGAAAGSMACIATVLNISMQYNNLNVIENSYGINLRPLAIFAQECYGSSEYFAPKLMEEEILKEKDVALISKIHKAIVMIQFKLEGQIIMRNKEFAMEDRLLLNKINYKEGTITLNGQKYELRDKEFPTIDINDPYKLREDEIEVMEQLVMSFKQSEKLQKHIQFLYQKGGLYKLCNRNLIFHGCIPTNKEGEFSKVTIGDETFSGKALLDKSETLVRKAYFARNDSTNKQKGMDFIWYLWCGKKSPLFGRDKMTTFERYFISDKTTWEERKDSYYKHIENEEYCNKILREFGLDEKQGHIINGHVPVKTKAGENPVKANGKLMIIDGGLCKAYRATTGIAGYTLIYNSKRMRIISHGAINDIKAFIENASDYLPQETIITETNQIKVGDTDKGVELKQQVDDLKELLNAYYNGTMKINNTSIESAIIRLTEKFL
ncbi:MAG: fructose-1,6-bisphosphatase [Clostridiales bacterium]|nr:fructose-1,6-bisphosphatase [Clostridiales bacterium]